MSVQCASSLLRICGIESDRILRYTFANMIGLAFTPEQFKALLRMIYVANTVVNAKEEDYRKEYDDLEQYIFSRAKDAGFPAATWSHKAGGDQHHHPSRIFENDPELTELLEAYDETATSEFLAEILAERDIEMTHGPDAKSKMPEKDYEALLAATAETYELEFNEHGFARLIVAK